MNNLMPGDQVSTGTGIGRVIARGAFANTRYVKVRDILTGKIRTYVNAEIDGLRRI